MKRRMGRGGDKKAKRSCCEISHRVAMPYIDNFRTAIDIGCRSGEYTKCLKNDFKDIECFEPRGRWINDFWRNVGTEKKYKKKIRFRNYALGDTEQMVRMYGAVIHDDDWWENTEVGKSSRYKKPKKCAVVQQKTLDSFAFKDVDFIKIDVEGHELPVIKGGIETISTYRPTIILEQNDRNKSWGKGRKFDAMDFLKTLGYKQVAFDGNMDYVMKFNR